MRTIPGWKDSGVSELREQTRGQALGCSFLSGNLRPMLVMAMVRPSADPGL